MARKTNSKEVKMAVRADLQEAINARAENMGPWHTCEPTANEIWQVFKMETPEDFIRQGRHACFERHLGIRGGGFMPEVYSGNVRETVARWLDQTPEEAAKYSDDRVEELYIHLLDREFAQMCSKTTPKEGYYAEYQPFRRRIDGKYEEIAAVHLYKDGHFVGGLETNPRDAHFLYDALHDSINGSGDVLTTLEVMSYSHDMDEFPMNKPLHELADCARTVRDMEHLVNEFAEGGISEDEYYAEMGRLDASLQNDPQLDVLIPEVVDQHMDAYFERVFYYEQNQRRRESRADKVADKTRNVAVPDKSPAMRGAESKAPSQDAEIAKSSARDQKNLNTARTDVLKQSVSK